MQHQQVLQSLRPIDGAPLCLQSSRKCTWLGDLNPCPPTHVACPAWLQCPCRQSTFRHAALTCIHIILESPQSCHYSAMSHGIWCASAVSWSMASGGHGLSSNAITSAPCRCCRDTAPVNDGIALKTLDIFAGCGGLSEGMHAARAADPLWAIEYEAPAAEAFRINHPSAAVWTANCNVILAAAMKKAGMAASCQASSEVSASLPLPAPPLGWGMSVAGNQVCTCLGCSCSLTCQAALQRVARR